MHTNNKESVKQYEILRQEEKGIRSKLSCKCIDNATMHSLTENEDVMCAQFNTTPRMNTHTHQHNVYAFTSKEKEKTTFCRAICASFLFGYYTVVRRVYRLWSLTTYYPFL